MQPGPVHRPRRVRLELWLGLCAVAACAALAVSYEATGHASAANLPPVVLGSDSSTESALLARLYGEALGDRGFAVTYAAPLSSAAAADRALRSGRIDLYADHTGAIVRRLGASGRPTVALAASLEAKRGVALLRSARFTSRSTLAVLRSTAQRYHLTSIADLRHVPRLTIGAGPLLRAAGAETLRRGYGLHARTVNLGTTAPLDALAGGRAIAVELPAGLTRGTSAVALRDPARALDAGRLVPTVNSVRLNALGPRFAGAIDSITRALTQRSLSSLTAKAAAGSLTAVARSYAGGLVVAANVFVAANGSDGGSRCRRFPDGVANPDPRGGTVCASLGKAYAIARPGDVVEIAAGEYPAQRLSRKSGANAPDVVMRPASGAKVVLDDLTTSGSHVTIEDLTIRTGTNHNRGWESDASYVTLDGVDVTGPYARVDIGGNATNVVWRNGSMGTPGNTVNRICSIDGGAAGDPEPVQLSNVTNLTFSNLDFYPFIAEFNNPACGPDNTMHLETIRVNDGVDNFRLERSRFHRGDGSGTARLFVTKLGGKSSDNLTVVNNWFGAADGKGGGSVSVLLGGNQPCNGYVFAYNQFEQGFVPSCNPMTSLTLVGNTGVGPSYLCEGTSHVRNVWTWSNSGSCGSDRWVKDRNFSLDALRYAPDGFHLLQGSPAIDAAAAPECAALTRGVDIDGQLRSGPCDAGPDEFSRR